LKPAGVAVLVVLLLACNGPALEQAEPSETWSLDSQPLYAEIASRVGYSMEEIEAATLRAQRAGFSKCLQDAGFAPDSMPLHGTPPAVSAALVGDVATAVVEVLTEEAASPGTHSQKESVPESIVSSCEISATEAIRPLGDLTALLDTAINEVSTLVQADPEYLQAAQDGRRCIASIGPETAQIIDEANQDDIAAVNALASYITGTISLDDARAEAGLAASRQKDRLPTLMSIRRCDAALIDVERRLVIREQLRFVEQNPEFVESVAGDFAELLRSSIDESYLD
jgi:hypothetical protein